MKKILGRLLGPLLKTGLPLIGNVLKPLAKNVLILSGLTATASAADEAIHKKVFGSGNTTLINSNKEINDIKKIIKSHEESGLLIKCISKTVNYETKGKREDFLECYFIIKLVYLGKCKQVKAQLEKVKAQLEQTRILNASSSFIKF